MLLRFRVFTFTSLLGIAASVILPLAEDFMHMKWHEFSTGFIKPNGLRDFLYELKWFVLPHTIPTTLVGGCIAGWVVGRHQHPRPRKSWIARGCFGGCAIAAVGMVLSFRDYIYAKSAYGLPEMLKSTSHVALVFGVVGAFVGAAVGTYCWYLMPPNPPLNPTGARGAPAG